jgi:hypothetical protein
MACIGFVPPKISNYMATEAQFAANRLNALKCTGPKTAGGKAASSKNSLKHGLYSATIVQPGEDQEEYDSIHREIQVLYQPRNSSERSMVDEMAVARWKLRRAELIEAELMINRDRLSPADAIVAYSRTNQIQTRLQHTWFKLYKELERLKANRAEEAEREAGKARRKAQKQTEKEPAQTEPQTLRSTAIESNQIREMEYAKPEQCPKPAKYPEPEAWLIADS